MKLFRKIVFWAHLIAGVIAGIAILIMSVTGAVLAFQPNILAFIERDARVVSIPTDTSRLDAKTLLNIAAAQRPNAKFTNLIISRDNYAAASLAIGREGTIYVNPYTGEITGENSKPAAAFFHFNEDWHRWLGATGEYRQAGKAVNDAANFAFLFLAISGIYIWFPRKLNWKSLKAIAVFRFDKGGRARDFNWHNVAGIWSSLILIILTATAVVMSYQWANNLLFRAAGSEPPQQQQRPPNAPNPDQNNTPFVVPENAAALWTRAEQQSPTWKTIALRLPVAENAVFTIDEGKELNKFGRSTLTLNASNAEQVKWESYSDQSLGRQLRTWVRFTHTGESFGIIGQIIAFLACLGGCLLVYSGFALSLRRLRGWLQRRSA